MTWSTAYSKIEYQRTYVLRGQAGRYFLQAALLSRSNLEHCIWLSTPHGQETGPVVFFSLSLYKNQTVTNKKAQNKRVPDGKI